MPSEEPRYRHVADELVRGIQSGKYAPGQKLPSEAALVKRFGTSRITIGRALRELKDQGLISGVAGSGNFVNAAPDPAAELVFGLLIPNLGETEIFEPICQGMASAPESGYALLWGHTSGHPFGLDEQALELCRQYISKRVDGVFFAPLELTAGKDRVNAKICAQLDGAGIPVVLLDRCILPFPDRSKYDLVGIDNRRAGYLATEHLIQAGCRDIAFFAREGAAPTVEARIAGYREALHAHGIDANPARIRRIGDGQLSDLLESMDAPAIVCANDRLAGQVMQVLLERGARIPGDVRVVGMDDVEYASLLPVPLTTVHQPCRAIGEAAISTMLARRQRPGMVTRDVTLACRLVIRKSSGV
jgi:DNA-binding LacI/PurR family transcriptional regulator